VQSSKDVKPCQPEASSRLVNGYLPFLTMGRGFPAGARKFPSHLELELQEWVRVITLPDPAGRAVNCANGGDGHR
jgi:hypothetical protein